MTLLLFVTTFSDKLDLIIKMLAWILVLIITVAICIPSVILSLQYSGDQCVIGHLWNVKLDQWLLVSALIQFLTIISFLPTVCCVWNNICLKFIPLTFILTLLLCFGLGK